MNNVNLDDHFGKPLPEELQPQHEMRARQFMDQANGLMSVEYPNVTFFANFLTGIEVFKGEEAEKALRIWDSPKMDEHRDPELKELLQEQVATGKRADVESATQSRVRCSMLGDQEEELKQALKKITLLAAEKGGSLSDTEERKNPFRGLKKRPGIEALDLDDLAKDFSLTSHFTFN